MIRSFDVFADVHHLVDCCGIASSHYFDWSSEFVLWRLYPPLGVSNLTLEQRKMVRSFRQLQSAEVSAALEPPAALHNLVVAPRHPRSAILTNHPLLLLNQSFVLFARSRPSPKLHGFARGGGVGYVCALRRRLCVGDRQLKHLLLLIVSHLYPSTRRVDIHQFALSVRTNDP